MTGWVDFDAVTMTAVQGRTKAVATNMLRAHDPVSAYLS